MGCQNPCRWTNIRLRIDYQRKCPASRVILLIRANRHKYIRDMVTQQGDGPLQKGLTVNHNSGLVAPHPATGATRENQSTQGR